MSDSRDCCAQMERSSTPLRPGSATAPLFQSIQLQQLQRVGSPLSLSSLGVQPAAAAGATDIVVSDSGVRESGAESAAFMQAQIEEQRNVVRLLFRCLPACVLTERMFSLFIRLSD